MKTHPKVENDEPVLVQEDSGFWAGEVEHPIPKPTNFSLDPAKIAKARADCDVVARLLGWK